MMNVFNSLGSNYDWQFVKKVFLLKASQRDRNELEKFLSQKYQGQVHLFYKGRQAMQLALASLKLPKNSKVVINGFTCYSAYKSVKDAGLEVAYLDLEPGDLNFSPATLIKSIKNDSSIKAVIVQNTLGYPCQMEKIVQICQQYKLILIEDLAHSIGTIYADGVEAGTVADLTVLSFSQDKVIDAISGGALIIRRPKYFLTEKIALLTVPVKQQLIDRFYPFWTFIIRHSYRLFIGKVMHFLLRKMNLLSQPMKSLAENAYYSLPNFQAALVLDRYKSLTQNLADRRLKALSYAKNLNQEILYSKIIKNIDNSSNLRLPIFVENRGKLVNHLRQKGVNISDIWYDFPIAPKRYAKFSNYLDQCPNAEKSAERILNLPTHQNLSLKQVQAIARIINLWQKSQ